MRRAADQRAYLVTGNGCVLRYMYSWVTHVQMVLCLMSLANRAGIHVFLNALRLIYSSWYVHRNKHAVGKDTHQLHSQVGENYCFSTPVVSQSQSFD